MAATGRPKVAKDVQARQSRPRNVRANVDKTGLKNGKKRGAPKAARAERNPSVLLAGIVAESAKRKVDDKSAPKLSGAAVKRVRAAAGKGLDVADLSALVQYQLEIARLEYAAGRLDPKDFMVALNKIGSQIAAAAQIAGGGDGGAAVTITFNSNGPSSTRPEALAQVRTTDPVIGDVIPCE